MTTKESATARLIQKRAKNRLVLIISAIAILWIVCLAVWAHSILFTKKPRPSFNGVVVDETPLSLWPDDYDHEELLASLKSCDPQENKKKCQTRLPEGKTQEVVGVLRPPGRIGDLFDAFIENIVLIHSHEKTDLLLVPTSHVGPEHHFTKIIRFAALPILLAAADVALAALPEKSGDVTFLDLEGVIRQLVRWHCSLSHLADDTALLTFTLEDLSDDPWEMETVLREFLPLTPHDPSRSVLEEPHIDEDEMIMSLDQLTQSCTNFVARSLGGMKPHEIEDAVAEIIDEELENNQSTCQSVMDVETSSQTGELSLVNSVVGHFLHPDPGMSDKICETRASSAIACVDKVVPKSARDIVEEAKERQQLRDKKVA